MAPYALREGGAEAWDARKADFGDRLLEEWRAFAPNLTADNVLRSYASGGPGYICANKIGDDIDKWWTPMEAPAWAEYATQAL